jgi:hypothetical protein
MFLVLISKCMILENILEITNQLHNGGESYLRISGHSATHFMEPAGSQELTSGPYPESDESSPNLHILVL